MLPPPPPPQPRVPLAEGPRASQREAGSGMNGGMSVSHCSAQAPQGIHNLWKALIAICTLTSFPLAQGTPVYAQWDAHLKDPIEYVHHRTDTTHSRSRSVAQEWAQRLCTKELRPSRPRITTK
jgi:hypothetical protein